MKKLFIVLCLVALGLIGCEKEEQVFCWECTGTKYWVQVDDVPREEYEFVCDLTEAEAEQYAEIMSLAGDDGYPYTVTCTKNES
jgi:hypothetical protein